MSDYNDQFKGREERVAQQAVKPQASAQPRESYAVTPAAPVTRHPRSDRHRTPDMVPPIMPPPPQREASFPQDDPAADGQWVRQQPEAPVELASHQRPVRRREDDQLYMRRPPQQNGDDYDYEDEDEEEYRSSPLPKILLALVLVVVVGCAALYFVPNAGPLQSLKDAVTDGVNSVVNLISPQEKAAPQALSFQTVSNSGVTDSRLMFHLTTTNTVEGVRIEDAQGAEIPCTVSLVNGADETNKIWAITAVFTSPYEGEVYAAIKDGANWTRTDKWVSLSILAPTTQPTQVPVQTTAPTQAPTDAPVAQPTTLPATSVPASTLTASIQSTSVPVATWVPTIAPLPTDAPTQAPTTAPTQEPTQAPTQEPTQAPTPEPTAAPTQAPTAVPTASPLPRLEAQADAAANAKVVDAVFQGSKSLNDFSRTRGYIAPNPDSYSWSGRYGVLTFRGDNFRRNAAYGTADVEAEKLSVLWKSEIGGLRTADSGTLYGVGWTGQPAIVKWAREVREMMNLYESKKNISGLREVIFGAQDGKIYFLDLDDGTPTRDAISVGYPLKGSVAVDAYARPLLAVGQGISKLSNKTGDIGLHVYNLITGEKNSFLNGRKSSSQKQYSTNGAFDGTPLFLHESDAMVVAGENGLLYTVDLNSVFTYPNVEKPDVVGSLVIDPSVTYLRTKASAAKDTLVSVESSVAMYDKYIYMADTYGLLRCVDSDTMDTVWSVDVGDNTDAAIALDMTDDATVSLYTGNTAYSRLGSKKDVTIRRLNALTGAEEWAYAIKCDYDKNQLSGCKASPVVGQHAIDHLVIFTVNKVKEGGSRVIALNKETGNVAWEYAMEHETVSSPVAVYNESGEAWLIQADESGLLHLLNASTGKLCSQLDLEGEIQASPAVFKNTLVIGTCSKDNAFMYGIAIQ